MLPTNELPQLLLGFSCATKMTSSSFGSCLLGNRLLISKSLKGFRYGNQYYAIAQEIRNFTIVQEDADARCQLLSKSAVSSVEPVAFSLIDSSPCNGYSMASVVSCTFTSTKDTVDQFAVWVQSFPLPDVSGTCVPMQLAVHARTVQNMNPSPPIPPQRPSPPGPPPRPFPSPPPPPPSCPPTPPMLPSPPSRPPSAPPSPPSPPEEPPLPPSPPSTVQIASQNLCHSTCISWALSDGTSDPAAGQTSSCAGFYANLCTHDAQRFEALLIRPPQPPPPPLPPTSTLILATPINVVAAGGFDASEMQTSYDTTTECSDSLLTPCVPAEKTRPWIMLDLGQTFDDIFSVEVYLMPNAPPSAPQPPPYFPPDPLPGAPPPPPIFPAEPPSPPITPYPNWYPTWCPTNTDECIINNVYHHNNGICEDGLPTTIAGTVDAEVQVCRRGTDFTDCGFRPCVDEQLTQTYLNRNRRILQMSNHDDVGWVEIFVSRHIACTLPDLHPPTRMTCTCYMYMSNLMQPLIARLARGVPVRFAVFGTRCATLNTTDATDLRTVLRCTEGRDMAEGRFVYVRSFESARMLRIDGIKVYRNPSTSDRFNRRLDDIVQEEEKSIDIEEEKKHHDKHHISRMKRLRKNMLNLTEVVCMKRIDDPANAVKTRREAAILWAELDEATANSSCFDCVTLRPSNCTVWFASKVGVRSDVGPKAYHMRMLKEQLQNDEHERRRMLEDGLNQACCRVNKLTGEKTCRKEFCHKAIHQSSRARMGHILRRMHERGHIEMSVEQKVAVDVISPHLHTDPRCRAKDQHSKRVDPLVSEAECLASSMLTHIADKHGISKEKIDEELGKYGLTVAQMLAHPLKTASTASETMHNFKSNPAFANLAAKVRDKNRLADESRRKLRRMTRPPGRSLKNARDAVAEYKGTFSAVEPTLSRPKRNHRKLRSNVHNYMHNVSKFTSSLHNAATASRVTSLMPIVHTPQDESMLELTKNTLSAIVSADGSIVGTAARSAGSLGNIISKGAELANMVYNTAKENEKKPKQRRLSVSTLSMFYDEVEHRLARNMSSNKNLDGRRLEAKNVGLTLPESHVREHGWIAGITDWKQLVDDIHKASNIIIQRQDDRLQHIEDTGHLTSGLLKDEHKTGIGVLDLNAPPSTLGNKFRELHAWMTNRHKSIEKRNQHKRRMDKARYASRHMHEDIHQSVIGAAVEASVTGHDIVNAMWNTLENSNHHRASNARKLADSFLGAAATVPLLPTSVNNKYSSYQGTEGGVNYFNEAVRYIVYDTALCYLYAPDETHDGGDFGDGTRIQTHRTDRMCFPMIPAAPSKMEDFRTFYNLGTLNFNDLEYEKACSSDAVHEVLGALGIVDWSTNVIAVAPIGAVLRVAEGIDAVLNLYTSGMKLPTEVERGAVILCGLSQLGGLIFSILAMIVAMALCVCAPVGSAIALFLYRLLTENEEASTERNKEIDRPISGKRIQPTLLGVNRGVGPSESERLLPTSSEPQETDVQTELGDTLRFYRGL